jgi:peptidoglycan/xylan/chitin deacetylase (PgdA/CDA1 family)
MPLIDGALRFLGVLLYIARLHRPVMWLTRRIPKVVLYHAVDPADHDALRDLDANVPPTQFAHHLDFYANYYTVVSVDRLARQDVPDYALAITFDDGYRSVIEHAALALASRGLSATAYVVPGVTGNTRMIWVNELNWLARNYAAATQRAFESAFGLPPGSRSLTPRDMIDHIRARYASKTVRAMLDAIHRELGTDAAELARRLRLYMDWDEVSTLQSWGFTVGNHTWSHPSVPHLELAECRDEIGGGAAALSQLPHWVPSFAYPFGDCNSGARHTALQTGHRTVCEVGGINAPLRSDRIARVPVHPHTGSAGLFAELEVVATVKGIARALVERLGLRRANTSS